MIMKPINLYRAHRRGAKKRGIDFLFTFEEWLKIWVDSDHWHERGRKKGQYVMARFGDKGPYAADNVRIITNGDNTKESNCGRIRSEEHRAKIGEFHRNRVKTEAEKAKISKTLLGCKHGIERRANISRGHKQVTVDYLGNRMTISEALYASGSGISKGLVQRRLRKGWPDREAIEMPIWSKKHQWPSSLLG